jgi:amidase
MAAEFYSLVFPNIGEMYTDTSDPFGRVKVKLYFHNVGTDIYTPIEIDTKIKYCPHANYWRQARMPFNVTGQPGLVIPAGFSRDGLPLSLQLVGRPFTEPMLYRVAQFYEDATGWTKHHPAGLAD